MISIILSTITRILLPVLLLFSIFVLIRGHQEPGGGFVGGLIASMAFALYTIATGISHARRIFPYSPNIFIVGGLFFALLSGVLGIFTGNPAFTALWSENELPMIGPLSTPLLFDIGVYLVVFGASTGIIFTLKLKQ
ncbi:MAG: Na+/H+ antiporter subunit B [Bacteroidales bacterium]